jgi:hypothetical protein
MSCGRRSVGGTRFGRLLRRGLGLVLGGVLLGSVAGAPSAPATPVGEAGDIAGLPEKAVQATPNAVPSPPSTTPSPPVATPAPPRVPREPPTGAPSAPSPSPPGSGGAGAPSGDGITGAAQNAAGSVTSAVREAATRAIPSVSNERGSSARSEGGVVSAPRSNPDAGANANEAPTRARGAGPSQPPSIAAAREVALRRWFARIWPAIALGGSDAARGWVSRIIEERLLRPAVAAIARSLALVPPTALAVGDSLPGGHRGTGNDPQRALPSAPPVLGRGKIVYLVAITALLALLAFTIWKEFRSALRPHVR